MTKRMKVYLPRWILWILLPLMAVIWATVTYVAFAGDGRQQLGFLEWFGVSIVVVLVAPMIWLMTGRLPAYIIEMDEDDALRRP